MLNMVVYAQSQIDSRIYIQTKIIPSAKMPPVLLKPKLPLGVSHVSGKRTCVLFEPYESEPNERCPVCLEELPYARFIDLRCGHSACGPGRAQRWGAIEAARHRSIDQERRARGRRNQRGGCTPWARFLFSLGKSRTDGTLTST